jgi:hypothetical protein
MSLMSDTEGDIVLQNLGTSSVGLAIAQLGASMGLTVISATPQEMNDASFAEKVKVGSVKLAISGLSQNGTRPMLKYMAPQSVLVAYRGNILRSFGLVWSNEWCL